MHNNRTARCSFEISLRHSARKSTPIMPSTNEMHFLATPLAITRSLNALPSVIMRTFIACLIDKSSG